MRSTRIEFALIILLALLPAMAFWEIFSGALLLPVDWMYQDLEPWNRLKTPESVVNSRIKDAILDGYALDVVSSRAAQGGRVALRNPYAGGGIPHLAAGFSRMLYPPFWIYAVLDSTTAHNVEILLHLFLAELFAYLFLRKLGAQPAHAFLGGILYGFTPSIIHRAEISFILPSLVWFPLLLFFIEDLLTTGRVRSVVGLSGAVAFQLLAGHFPDIFLNLLATVAYATVRSFFLESGTPLLPRLVVSVAAVIWGFGLAAPFLIPSLELMTHVNRARVSLDALGATGHGIELFWTLLTPWFQRSQLYIGLVPLAFLPGALVRGPRGPVVALVGVLALGLAISTRGPVLEALHTIVPSFERLRYVTTFVSLASFAMALLAGVGIWAGRSRESPRLRLEQRLLRIALVGAILAYSLTWVLGEENISTTFRLPLAMLLLALGVVALELRVRKWIGEKGLVFLLCVVFSLDLFSYARAFNPRIDSEEFPVFPDLPSIEFLKRDGDRFRVASLAYGYNSPFWPNTLGAYGIEDVAAYHSLLPQELGDYVEKIRRYAAGASGEELTEEGGFFTNWVSVPTFRPTHLLRIWNIKYFLLPAGWPNPDPVWLELVYDGEVRIFLFRSWLPRVWLAQEAQVLPDQGAIYMKLLDPTFDPERTVLMETEPSCWLSDGVGENTMSAEKPVSRIVQHHSEYSAIETRSSQASYLYVSESYDPGWKARVDGKEAAVLRANLHFLAVPLLPGDHQVELFYAPRTYWWGWAACGGSLATILVGVLMFRRRRNEAAASVFVLGLSAVPLVVGVAGWSFRDRLPVLSSCGQLRVEQRFLSSENSSVVHHRDFLASAVASSVPAELHWPLSGSEGGLLRSFFTTTDRSRTGEAKVTVVLRRPGEEDRVLGALSLRGRLSRWTRLEAPIPSGGGTLVFQLDGEPSLSILLAAPLVLRATPNRRSHILFALPESTRVDSPPLTDLLSEGQHRIFLGPNLSPDRTSFFDEVYISSEDDFHLRLDFLIPHAFRTATFLVIQPPAEGEGARQQLALVERMLQRLRAPAEELSLRVISEEALTELLSPSADGRPHHGAR